MKKITLALVFSLTLLSFACQRHTEMSYHSWQSGQDVKIKNSILKINFEPNQVSTDYKNKKIQFSRQLINGKPVLNSFIKKVSTNSEIEILQAQIIDENDTSINIQAIQSLKKVDFAKEIKKQSSDYKKIEVLSTEEMLVIENKRTKPYTVVSFFDKFGTPYLAFFDQNGNFVRTSRTGSQFSDINTLVYVDGPKLSQLSDQILRGVSAEPSLSNSYIYVTSESDKKINAINSTLKYDTKDDRFDQIQVFYYLNKSQQWMKDYLQVQVPVRIDAVVHIGFPEKSNSAFYFQNKIRFGQGDNKVYSNIPQDASIVYHESFHALIDSLSRLPFEGEGGSLNEAFADFFTCLMTDRPYLGESSYLQGPYKRNLVNNRNLHDKNGGLYHDSLIVSGLLWETKEKIGAEKTKNLAVETLIRLNSASQFIDFGKAITDASTQLLNQDDILILQQVLKSRGF